MRVEFSTYRGPKGICGEQVREIPNDGKHLEHGSIESTKTDFAFIRPDDNGPSVFVHCAECDFLWEIGLRVTYILTSDKSGRSRAAVCRKE
jgi:cold shock CspA family protein